MIILNKSSKREVLDLKKIKFVFFIIMIVSILFACSSINNSDDRASNSVTVSETNTNQTGTDEMDTEETNFSINIDRDATLSPYVVVGVDVQIILKNDGTVVARGLNSHGELGNGERTNSESWVQVKDLENVVGIYSFSEFGWDYNEIRNPEYCYALTEKGELYKWGGNILTPQKITTIPQIKNINQFSGEMLIINCINGEKYILYANDEITACNLLQDNEKLYDADIIVDDSHKSGYVLSRNGGKEAVFLYELDNNEGINIDLQGKEVIYAKGKYLLCSDHTMLEMIAEESGDAIATEDTGAAGVVQMDLDTLELFSNEHRTWNMYYLFTDGKMRLCGNNEYGQLGDGTLSDYYDDYLTIDDAEFKEFYFCDKDFYGNQKKFVIAIDSEYNIWAWGGEYGTSPKIIINNTDFLDAQIN